MYDMIHPTENYRTQWDTMVEGCHLLQELDDVPSFKDLIQFKIIIIIFHVHYLAQYSVSYKSEVAAFGIDKCSRLSRCLSI